MGRRELLDVILPTFETAVALAGAGSVMNSYSDVDGVFSADPALAGQLSRVLMAETGSLGVRSHTLERWPAARTMDEVDATVRKAQEIDDRTVVIDFRCDPEEKCYPMVPAGASNDEIVVHPSQRNTNVHVVQ